MVTYYKPRSPIQSGEDFIYPITTADQIIKSDKSRRLEQAGLIVADNSTSLGGVAAEDYALKTDTAPDSSKLGGIAAIDYALKTDTAPDSSKLGGKAPEYYIQPRNLLDNSDFSNPINQRGISRDYQYFSNAYTIDRWKLDNRTGGQAGIKLSEIGVVISNSGNYSEFMQYVIADTGKKYTLAVGTGDGVKILSGVPSANPESQFLKMKLSTQGYVKCYITIPSSEITLHWAALYEGSYTADTLPPYVPKGYAAELAECQRYYLPVSEYWNMGVILTGTGYICLNIPTNIKMRISPTTIMSNPCMYHPAYNWVDLTYRTLEWHAPFYRIIFDWPSSIQASMSDIVLINGVTGLSADL